MILMSFNFKEYIESKFPKDWKIVDTLDVNWNGKDTLAVITLVDGASDFQGARSQPFQIMVYTLDFHGVKDNLDTFQREHNQEYIRRDLQDIVQSYNPPVAIPQISTNGEDYYYQFYMAGFLQIADNLDDIKEVYIDDTLYETFQRQISYSVSTDTQNKNISTEEIETIVRNSQVTINLNLIPRAGSLINKLRAIKTRVQSCNTSFKIKLVYNDDTEEEYTMKLLGMSTASINGAIVTTKLEFGE